MRYTVVCVGLTGDIIIEPDVTVADMINKVRKNIRIEAMTEEQYYSALKNELMKFPDVKRVLIIRGLYARDEDEAKKQANEIYTLTYGRGEARGFAVFPSFYQIIDPVKGETSTGDKIAAVGLLGIFASLFLMARKRV